MLAYISKAAIISEQEIVAIHLRTVEIFDDEPVVAYDDMDIVSNLPGGILHISPAVKT